MRDRERVLQSLEKVYRAAFQRAEDAGDQDRMSRLDLDYQRDQIQLEVLLDIRELLAAAGDPSDEGSTVSLLEKAQKSMTVESISQFRLEHQGWFSDKAIEAQKERINKIVSMIAFELQKREVELTPRQLVENFVSHHSTFSLLDDPVKRFFVVGKVSGDPSSYSTAFRSLGPHIRMIAFDEKLPPSLYERPDFGIAANQGLPVLLQKAP